MRLYLVRHAKPDIRSGVCYGSSDVGVSPEENAAAFERLRRQLPLGAPVYSSPLQRCCRLAALISPDSYTVDARLAEMDFGAWELRAWDDIPRTEIDAWANDLVNFRPGAGESVMRVTQRVHAFFRAICEQKHDAVIVICHAGTMRLLVECVNAVSILDVATRAASAAHQIAYGDMLVLEFGK